MDAHFSHIALYYRWRYEVAGMPVPTRILSSLAWYTAAVHGGR